MAWDLEGLIAGLLVLISCGGEQGCSVTELLQAIQHRIGNDQTSSQQPLHYQGDQDGRGGNLSNSRAVGTIWGWLVQRPDVSMGPERKYNHLSLHDVLTRWGHSASETQAENQGCQLQNQIKAPDDSSKVPTPSLQGLHLPEDFKVFASEDTLWQSITSHGVDYKRVPRSEWLLLLGIASTKSDGILQGDLCRLVDQDKRSVPKRTDALFKKGYISKRTTLVRGTKTSKLWITKFAPVLPRESAGTAEPSTAGMDLSPKFLTSNLDPVPWHTRWTGDSMDYIALATTIMAVAKAWTVMRLTDMKSKLGVLGKRWQLKVVSKTCRFLNARGVIQYVAATLDDRVFKDCVRFVRDLDSKDWALYLATGKRNNAPSRTLGSDSAELFDGAEHTTHLNAGPSLLANRPRWTPDEPLPQFIIKIVRSFGDPGLTNPDIYSLTVGPSFTRFISSLTSTMATSNVQPRHLAHFQLKYEHVRSGKVASYRYYLHQDMFEQDPKEQGQAGAPYGFPSLGSKSRELNGIVTLADLCGAKPSKRKPRGRPRIQRAQTLETDGQMAPEDHQQAPEPPGGKISTQVEDEPDVSRYMVHLKVQPEALKLALVSSPNQGLVSFQENASDELEPPVDTAAQQIDAPSGTMQPKEPSPSHNGSLTENANAIMTESSSGAETRRKEGKENGEFMDEQGSRDAVIATPTAPQAPANDDPTSTPGAMDTTIGRGRGRGRPPTRGRPPGSGRGRGRSRARARGRGGVSCGADAASTHQWKCENCGGSWKNDIGLKYHLEKSRTSCNPNYDPTAEPPKRAKRAKLEEALSSFETMRQGIDGQSDATGDEQKEDGDRDMTDSLLLDGLPASSRRSQRRQDSIQISTETPGGSQSEIEHALGRSASRRTQLDIKRGAGEYSSKVSGSRKIQAKDPLTPRAYSAPRTGQGLLLSAANTGTRQVPDIVQHRRAPPPTPTPLPRNIELCQKTPIKLESIPPELDESPVSLDMIDPRLRDENGSPARHQRESPSVLAQIKTSTNLDSEAISGGSSLSKAEKTRIVGNLIQNIISEHDGVFPGGEALWRTLKMSWDLEHHLEPVPSSKDFQTALRSLLSKKVVTESWHAFRGHNGMFSKCQLITLPEIDAFSHQALELIDRIKATHPKLYIPGQALPEKNQVVQAEREFIRTRRRLPMELSVLDAPVYAAQIAAKRGPGDEDDTGRRRKRRRKETHLEEPNGRIRFTSDWPSVFHEGVTKDLVPSSGPEAVYPLQFLDPNTYMEEEPPGYSPEEMFPKKKQVDKSSKKAAEKAADKNPSKSSKQPKARLLEDATGPSGIVQIRTLSASGPETWSNFDVRFFEECDLGFTLAGWFPTSQWFAWETINYEISKRAAAKTPRGRFSLLDGLPPYQRFMNKLQACVEVEMAWEGGFVHGHGRTAGPHNIFVNFFSGPVQDFRESGDITWAHDEQLTLDKTKGPADGTNSAVASSTDDEEDFTITYQQMLDRARSNKRGRKYKHLPDYRKRVQLTSRRLTALPQDIRNPPEQASEEVYATESISNPDELLAAIIAVRALLGGIDRAIDWGLLIQLFPELGLDDLRKFWVATLKSQSAHVAKLTQVFQENFIAACENEELPMVNFDQPLDYDWTTLIQWTMDLATYDGVSIPGTQDQLREGFSIDDAKTVADDWRERFFHPQSSTYGRLDAVTAEPGAVTIEQTPQGPALEEVDIARSWIKSLCCTHETKYDPEDVKHQFLKLGQNEEQKVVRLLKQAIDQLTAQKIIYKSRRSALGGRPYRLTEQYTSALSKFAQSSKYEEATEFKAELDKAFRRGQSFKIPYTINDGAVMALINMNAFGRVRIRAVDVPHIPFGFEPGNYESRKFPKSYYHFGLTVVPTETYQYNEDIETLKLVAQTSPPTQGAKRELPQWIDFFGKSDTQRWCDVLGGVCFAYSTRGQLSLEGICSAAKPILEEFEAQMVLDWSLKTGVFENAPIGKGVIAGEWWWLAVPWQRRFRG